MFNKIGKVKYPQCRIHEWLMFINTFLNFCCPRDREGFSVGCLNFPLMCIRSLIRHQ